ncbi:unnamed protein product [Closterium sp. Naga37s-1]|nr:unnamed protein product [Closterium sp. Naga37s-1]
MALRFHGRMGSTAVDARKAAKLSGMSPPAYARARAAIQNALGVSCTILCAVRVQVAVEPTPVGPSVWVHASAGVHPTQPAHVRKGKGESGWIYGEGVHLSVLRDEKKQCHSLCETSSVFSPVASFPLQALSSTLPPPLTPSPCPLPPAPSILSPHLTSVVVCLPPLSFTARFTAALPEARRGGTDFSRPAHMAAALMLTATRNQVVACMEAHCADLFGSSHSCPTPSKAQEHSLPRQHPPEQCMHAADVAHLHQQRHHQQPQSIAAADVAEHQRSTTSADVAPQSQAPASRSNNRTMPLPQAKLTLLKRPPGRYRVSGPTAMNHHMPHLTCPSPRAPPRVPLPACPSPRAPPRVPLPACPSPRAPPRVPLPACPSPRAPPRVPLPACPSPRAPPRVPLPACPSPRAPPRVPLPACPSPRAPPRVPLPACPSPRAPPRVPLPACPSPRVPPRVSLPACPSPRVPPRVSLPACPSPRVPPRVSLPACPSPRVPPRVSLPACPSPRVPPRVSLPACPSPRVPPRVSLPACPSPRVPPRVSLPTYPAPHVSRPVKPTPFVSPCPPRPYRQAVSDEAAL